MYKRQGLTHAVMDALLGAAALGDIGQHFPDTDPAYLGADSMALLREVIRLLEGKGYRVGNIDATPVSYTHLGAQSANADRTDFNCAACCSAPLKCAFW